MQASRKPDAYTRGGFGLYHIAWAGSAVIAAGYLAVVAFQPELVARLADASTQLASAGAERGQAADLRLELRVEDMARDVVSIEHGLADVRRAAASHRDVTEALTARVTALEARLDPENDKVSQMPAPAGKRVVLSQADDQRLTTIPKVINPVEGEAAARIVTGSVPATPPPPVKGPATVQVPVGTVQSPPVDDARAYGLELARGATLEVLRARWAEVLAKNSARLNGLAPHYRLVVDPNGDPLRLIVGPVVGEANARVLCRDLAVLGTRCRYAGFSGTPL